MANKPVFTQIDPFALNKLATDYSEKQYANSAANAVSPLLAEGTRFETDQAANRLAGVPDPQVSGALSSAGLGAVDLPGDPFAEARSLGRSGSPSAIESIDTRNRNHFANLFKANPKKPFGLGIEDIGNIAVNNSGGQAAFQQGLANAETAAKNAESINTSNNITGILGALGTAAGGVSKVAASSPSPYLSSFFYGGGYNPAYAGPNYGSGYANQNLPVTDPNYGNSNYIGLGDTDTSGIAGSSSGY